jgi:ABC-type sugar transport system substrate-binding protein
MTRHRILSAAALCAATLLAATAAPALAVDAAATGKPPTSPDQPKPRTGDYTIISQGSTVTHVKCAEGGHVFVATREHATPAQHDHDLRESCKTVDFTK